MTKVDLDFTVILVIRLLIVSFLSLIDALHKIDNGKAEISLNGVYKIEVKLYI